MEQYFHAAHVRDEDKVTITTMYLVDDAKLWWQTRVEDDVSASRPKIDSWEGLKKELKDQFFPSNAGWIARDRLKKLKQTGTVGGYVKDFSSLMLDISNMSEEDKLHNFLYGLQSWAQMELRRQNVKDLPSAIATADALGDFRLGQDGSDFSTTLKSKNGNKDKGKEWRKNGNTRVMLLRAMAMRRESNVLDLRQTRDKTTSLMAVLFAKDHTWRGIVQELNGFQRCLKKKRVKMNKTRKNMCKQQHIWDLWWC